MPYELALLLGVRVIEEDFRFGSVQPDSVLTIRRFEYPCFMTNVCWER